MAFQYGCLYQSYFKLDGGAMFGIIPKPLWEKRISADKYNRIEMSLRCLFLRRDQQITLIDFGCGNYHGEKFEDRFGLGQQLPCYQEILKNHLNIDCRDVTDIIVSHLHFDHCGGLLQASKPNQLEIVFPKATLHLHKQHYDYALRPTPRDQGSFHPHCIHQIVKYYEKQQSIHFLEREEGNILPDLNFICIHGHTPYQILPYTSELMFGGDLIPTAHHIDIPWVMGYDLHPGQSTLDRQRIYDFLISKNLFYVFDHDLDHIGGKISQVSDNKYQWSSLVHSKKGPFELFQVPQ